MKIEEIKKENSAKGSYWFPLQKGYNRLLLFLMSISAIIAACAVEDEDSIFGASVLTVVAEVCVYFAIVWIYQGFNEK